MTILSGSICRCDALYLLERLPEGVAGLVYFDPPWPRGNDRTVEEWDSSTSFEDHMSYLAEVLERSRRALLDRGNVCFHTDLLLAPHARHVLDEVYGRECFQTEVVLPLRRRSNRSGPSHTQLIFYGKSVDSYHVAPTRPLTKEEIARAFTHSDERGPYRFVALTQRISRPRMAFEWRGVSPPSGHAWKYPSDRLDSLDAEGRVVWRAGLPRLKSYLDESAGVELGSVWDDVSPRPPIIDGVPHPTAQPVEILRRVIGMTTIAGDLVVDPFCGTGVAALAAEASGRRWIVGDKSPAMTDVAAKRLSDLGLRTEPPIREDERSLSRA